MGIVPRYHLYRSMLGSVCMWHVICDDPPSMLCKCICFAWAQCAYVVECRAIQLVPTGSNGAVLVDQQCCKDIERLASINSCYCRC
jgi:hypothetical protein